MLLGAAAVAGVALRFFVYRSMLGAEDSDEAILGLMVRHAAHGHLTAFLWGEAYGGILEVLLTVPVFWLFGSSVLALRVVPIALDVATAFLVWRVGRRTIGEPAARVAAAVYWIWPAWSVYEHVHQVGFYASDCFFTALILLLVLRAKESPTAVSVGALGLVCGLAEYQTQQIVTIAIPALAWLVWRRRRVLRYAWLAAILALVGLLPALVWNLQNDWATLKVKSGGDFSYVERLHVLVATVLPEELGLRFVDTEKWIVPSPLGLLAAGVLGALFVLGAVRNRGRAMMLVYLTAAVFPFIYATSSKAIASSDPRYTTVLAPCLALIVGQAGSTLRRASAVLALVLVASIVGLRGAEQSRAAHTLPGPVTPRSLTPLVESLDRLGIRRVFANYWLAYRLDFDTNERIVAVENGFDSLAASNGDVLPPRDPGVKWRHYEDAVRSGPRGFVFFKGYEPQPGVLSVLARNGYERRAVDGFVVYYRPATG